VAVRLNPIAEISVRRSRGRSVVLLCELRPVSTWKDSPKRSSVVGEGASCAVGNTYSDIRHRDSANKSRTLPSGIDAPAP
jgi:hypothetical protein